MTRLEIRRRAARRRMFAWALRCMKARQARGLDFAHEQAMAIAFASR